MILYQPLSRDITILDLVSLVALRLLPNALIFVVFDNVDISQATHFSSSLKSRTPFFSKNSITYLLSRFQWDFSVLVDSELIISKMQPDFRGIWAMVLP